MIFTTLSHRSTNSSLTHPLPFFQVKIHCPPAKICCSNVSQQNIRFRFLILHKSMWFCLQHDAKRIFSQLRNRICCNSNHKKVKCSLARCSCRLCATDICATSRRSTLRCTCHLCATSRRTTVSSMTGSTNSRTAILSTIPTSDEKGELKRDSPVKAWKPVVNISE